MKKIIFIMMTLIVVVTVWGVLNVSFIKQKVSSEVIHSQKAYKRGSSVAKAVIDNGSYSEWFPSEKNTQRVVELIDGKR